MSKFHIPVMTEEVLNYLNLAPGKIIVDATMGTAGHSRLILERILPGGRLIGIDRDKQSLESARQRLSDFSGSCDFVHGNFMNIDTILKSLDVKKIDGVLFDLGISSFQLEDPQRGFSFQNEGPLDMRLDTESYISAYDLVNNLTEEEISNLLWSFGQERWHNRIAHLLVEERKRSPISTTSQLADIVTRSIPARYRYRYHRIHPATRTFQAVRIAVNRELESLEEAINKAFTVLEKGGRICVISFHSLEDRIVKFAFRHAAGEQLLNIITPKPLVPRFQEVESNPSSRSSKLRVGEKI
ncbi:MAG: 16S rRNA (cytosine(1402)-N(4))-methyltransferase RsmH [Candidatus Omnitrophica bacterium]|nr:16S rRNA (cytosine(1402)-N(4))-methyltransferase RsmH [Candidatus Omnitrophota bacterium]